MRNNLIQNNQWDDESIKVAYKNTGIRKLAELIYEEQCEYVGKNHGEFCIQITQKFITCLMSMKDALINSKDLELRRLQKKCEILEKQRNEALGDDREFLSNSTDKEIARCNAEIEQELELVK